MPPITRNDPYGVYNFLVQVTGVAPDGQDVQASFTEVSGLTVDIQPIEYRNGSDKNNRVTKQTGLTKHSNLVLKRGITGHPDFWNWVKLSMNGQTLRATGSIMLLDENRQEVMRWNFDRAWPVKYTGPSLGATKNEIAMETLELCVEALQIDV
ncbi:phage tail protein [Streptomyces sp. NBC_01381]|uniref:phage tail protein n=1 Tax=Streptomyces sp. NBC_01381 TaxID=2903845 RepID=UPI00224D09E2|nr:phage tail protein [Streptomyces sp. NBC_01381]MCX4673193.1 phage tail protein [Streptomyces sp. NBC_01381]